MQPFRLYWTHPLHGLLPSVMFLLRYRETVSAPPIDCSGIFLHSPLYRWYPACRSDGRCVRAPWPRRSSTARSGGTSTQHRSGSTPSSWRSRIGTLGSSLQTLLPLISSRLLCHHTCPKKRNYFYKIKISFWKTLIAATIKSDQLTNFQIALSKCFQTISKK